VAPALRALLLVCIASLSAPASRADQGAPELDGLFEALAAATDVQAASAIEQRIWSLWFEAPDDTAESLLNRARDAASAGDLESALALFEDLTNRYPQFAEGWNQRAILHYLRGDVQGSLDDIARALELEPRHFGALAGRGQCYLRLDRPQESLAAFEASLAINPWSPDVRQQAETLRTYLNQKLTPI
jgi:tetratricopeptide (TPR) repeat protein